MSDDSKDNGFLIRVQQAVRSGQQRVGDARSGLVERVKETLGQRVAPAVEAGARKALLKLAEPENAQKLQETLATFAGFAMRSGFESDPKARLLFDFVDGLEQDHSREAVMKIVVEHAVVYEQDLLTTLLATVQSGESAAGRVDPLGQFRERASSKLLALLCALASLEGDEPPPQGQDAQVAYFESAPIDERYKPLARMAIGDEQALAEAADSKEDAAAKRPRANSKGVVKRTLERLRRDETTALARFIPSLSDPATQFLTTTYLFFVQSYVVRAMIEGLPDVLGAVRDLEQEAASESPDVIDVDE
ncbi:hypothetical protein FIV42_29230 [Persicimonas caeni]|uniref:Uncharacterized protein n=1 Tax=Persicimonas caeni TaxID=2292766 RepID=A0A4Y6Q2H6_PERCE|nr:hypothetical protein [Persicimonas caeni]QDG54679.1 hypothetical protein FIV42_29230 [Persicimonas caeni]QED35900.1 hypothetical protein FRD00_29225 [Persicimonas caeni]